MTRYVIKHDTKPIYVFSVNSTYVGVNYTRDLDLALHFDILEASARLLSDYNLESTHSIEGAP